MLPEELLIQIDEAAKANYMSRSEYIRRVLHKEIGKKYEQAIKKLMAEDPVRFLDLDDS
jgi:metal-responsive CopG/Arc/MetJ family transcriptional regulator